ncbi:MAG: DNA translocase FtsK [Anaerolineae bacterium]
MDAKGPGRSRSIGLALLLLGIWMLASLLAQLPGHTHLLRLIGWGAYPLGLALLGTGAGLIARPDWPRLWRWEALLGGELLWLTALTATGLGWPSTDPDSTRAAGGLVGWALAEALTAALGRSGAWAVTLLVMASSLALLYWATPASWRALAGWRIRSWATYAYNLGVAAIDAWRSARVPGPAEEDENIAIDTLEEDAATPTESSRSPRPRARGGSLGAQGRSGRRSPTSRKSPAHRSDDLPPLDLLVPEEADAFGDAAMRDRANLIERTLASFGVPARVIEINVGPTVTQFGVEPGYIERGGKRRKVRVSRIQALANDLALELAAPSIRIEAPVPGRPYVGIEVPNGKASLVNLRGVLESPEFQSLRSPLAIALGRDVSGAPVVADLARMPHLLIAGATGTGKSVCINSIITCLLMNNSPERLQFMMIDPKMVELVGYNGIPHLIAPVITDLEQVVPALVWLTLQMDERYRKFNAAGVRNIETYNARMARRKNDEGPLPYIVVVIDELADLMMTAPEDVERNICRLAQMARATGIHLVIATQRPSVDVVTGLIKANFPARIAFAVTSGVDSRVILDQPGAEKLLGRGDMLFMAPDASKLRRVQGCFVSDREIKAVTDFWRRSGYEAPPVADSLVPWASLLDEMDEGDDLIQQAIEILRGEERASASMLQRRLRIGYPRAARLMEELEEMGVVGPDEGGGRARKVLLGEADDDEEDDLLFE